MNGAVAISLQRFFIIYLLLLLVLALMKLCRVSQSKLLLIGSIRMTVQLVLAGLILTYIFKHPHPLFTVAYVVVMMIFSIHRVLSKNADLNRRFKAAVGFSLACSGISIILFFCACDRKPEYL